MEATTTLSASVSRCCPKISSGELALMVKIFRCTPRWPPSQAGTLPDRLCTSKSLMGSVSLGPMAKSSMVACAWRTLVAHAPKMRSNSSWAPSGTRIKSCSSLRMSPRSVWRPKSAWSLNTRSDLLISSYLLSDSLLEIC